MDERNDDLRNVRARKHLVVLLVLGTVVGAAWGLGRYDSLADVRAWNLAGFVVISFVFAYALGVAIFGSRDKSEPTGSRNLK